MKVILPVERYAVWVTVWHNKTVKYLLRQQVYCSVYCILLDSDFSYVTITFVQPSKLLQRVTS